MSVLASLLLLAAMALLGICVLVRAPARLTLLERVAYGAPLGMVVATLPIVPLAGVLGLTVPLVVGLGVTCVGVAALLLGPVYGRYAAQSERGVAARLAQSLREAARQRLASWGRLTPWVTLGGFAILFAVYGANIMAAGPDGLWSNVGAVASDWSLHLGNVTSFAYGDNFPPSHPRYLGDPLAYHYLADVTPAAFITLGLDPPTALVLHTVVLTVLVAAAVYAFARRITGDRGKASLALVLFLLGGSLAWVLTADEVMRSGDLVGTLLQNPWNNDLKNELRYSWNNIVFAFLLPQRPFEYGLSVGLLALTLFLEAIGTSDRRTFIAAGIVAGLLPLAHLATMLALALITPFLFLRYPSRNFILAHFVWVAVAVPQLLVQLGGGAGHLRAIRFQVGWLAGSEWVPAFWLRNLGLILPLFAVALLWRDVLPRQSRFVLLAFAPIFIVANLVVFQPWDYDNNKIMVYTFLAACIAVAALLVTAWRRYRAPLARLAVAAALASMLLSGALENLHYLLGHDRQLVVNSEGLALAAEVRERTPPHAVFLVGLQARNPVPVLTGRQVLMGYPGWLWSEGIPYQERERDLRTMFALEDEAEQLFREYGIDYVVIGPDERRRLGADVVGYRERYPIAVSTPNYEVFEVRARQASR